MNFNPLSLYRERPEPIPWAPGLVLFQSTLPIQGETTSWPYMVTGGDISIHSPYTGRDAVFYQLPEEYTKFQSTLPIQGETPAHVWGAGQRGISIHSPYTGRDRFIRWDLIR